MNTDHKHSFGTPPTNSKRLGITTLTSNTDRSRWGTRFCEKSLQQRETIPKALSAPHGKDPMKLSAFADPTPTDYVVPMVKPSATLGMLII
ncbi:unnamed protein product [Prunus armeniaca]